MAGAKQHNPPSAAPHQPFWACRCLRSELRRMIRALATRTASALEDGFFGSGVFASPAVGIMVDCVAAIEPWPTGCTLIGPVDVGLLSGIMDNARRPNSFDARKRPGCRSRSPTLLAEPGRLFAAVN
jgi:hypothetical protein